MSAQVAVIDGRGVVKVAGTDARNLLNNVITVDVTHLERDGDAVHAGLLTPQGKILAGFFVVRLGDAFLIDVAASAAADLVKRLSMYKLRANATIDDVSATHAVIAVWDGVVGAVEGAAVAFRDPRHSDLGQRIIVEADRRDAVLDRCVEEHGARRADASALTDHRLALGVAAFGVDFGPNTAFPHDVNWDLMGSVDFKKGCFVGQEVVSRMQHKSVPRRRLVRLSVGGPGIGAGDEIKAGAAVLGNVASVAGDGRVAIAIVRMDRAVEAIDGGTAITTADGAAIALDAEAVAAYRGQKAKADANAAPL